MPSESNLNINDIAERAGVSIATVSRYMNGHLEKMSQKTAENIQKIINETGYVPNASAVQLMTRQSRLVAVMAANVDDYFSTEFFKGASSILEANQFTGVLFDTDSDEARELSLLARIGHQNFDGLIIQPLTNDADKLRGALKANLPIVVIDREFETDVFDSVVTDNQQAIERVGKAYREAGFKQAVVITEPINGISTREERWQGVQNIFPDAEMINVTAHTMNSEKVYETLREKLTNRQKTLVVVFKERILLSLLPTLIRHGELIEQIALTGFADTALAKVIDPKMKLIQQDPFLMGATAAELLLKQILKQGQDGAPEKIVIAAKYR